MDLNFFKNDVYDFVVWSSSSHKLFIKNRHFSFIVQKIIIFKNAFNNVHEILGASNRYAEFQMISNYVLVQIKRFKIFRFSVRWTHLDFWRFYLFLEGKDVVLMDIQCPYVRINKKIFVRFAHTSTYDSANRNCILLRNHNYEQMLTTGKLTRNVI